MCIRPVSFFAAVLGPALLAAACGSSSPTAPSAPPPPTTGVLTVRLDAACAGVRVVSADLFIDGQYVEPLASGGAYTTTVSIGSHNVEASAYNVLGIRVYHWGPAQVYVPAGGYTELFYCQ